MATTHRILPAARTVFRIGDLRGNYPIYSAEGARRIAGRWHEKGDAVIYTAEHLSLAMLEKLVHFSGSLPAGQHFIAITLPTGTPYEVVTAASLPGWDAASHVTSRPFGHDWVMSARSAVLLVPSVVVPDEMNVIINPQHPAASNITVSLEQPIRWDDRLFA